MRSGSFFFCLELGYPVVAAPTDFSSPFASGVNCRNERRERSFGFRRTSRYKIGGSNCQFRPNSDFERQLRTAVDNLDAVGNG